MLSHEYTGAAGLVIVTPLSVLARGMPLEAPTLIRNLITDAGLNLKAELLGGLVTSPGIDVVAWGTSPTPPASTDTELGNETGRVTVSTSARSDIGQLTTAALIPSTVVGQIEELGFFAGDVLISRVLYSRNKTALESISVTRVDTYARI